MPMLMVSPGYQSCLKRRHFQARDGSTPIASPAMSMPVRLPKPSIPMNSEMASILRSLAST